MSAWEQHTTKEASWIGLDRPLTGVVISRWHDTALLNLCQGLNSPKTTNIVAEDFNKANLKNSLWNLTNISQAQPRGVKRTGLTDQSRPYSSVSVQPIRTCRHISHAKYKQRMKQEAPVTREVTPHAGPLNQRLQDVLSDAAWDMFLDSFECGDTGRAPNPPQDRSLYYSLYCSLSCLQYCSLPCSLSCSLYCSLYCSLSCLLYSERDSEPSCSLSCSLSGPVHCPVHCTVNRTVNRPVHFTVHCNVYCPIHCNVYCPVHCTFHCPVYCTVNRTVNGPDHCTVNNCSVSCSLYCSLSCSLYSEQDSEPSCSLYFSLYCSLSCSLCCSLSCSLSSEQDSEPSCSLYFSLSCSLYRSLSSLLYSEQDSERS